MISLVVFLGNFGKQYKNNRHNVAWQFADSLNELKHIGWQAKFKGTYAQIKVTDSLDHERPVYFLKPKTYMNCSGESIISLCNFFRIKPENILVIHDELELNPGTVSLKWSGGLGGHNGLRSTKAYLGTADFWRLRFGIGRPNHSDVAGYVLSDFSQDEQSILYFVFKEAEQLFQQLLVQNPKNLLKDWAKKEIT